MPESSQILVAAYYRFVHLPDFRDLREPIRELAQRLGILGTVLVAEEGINSTVCGSPNAVEEFFEELGRDARLKDFDKRLSYCDRAPFAKLKVRLKREIVRMNVPEADPKQLVGEYVSPSDWNDLIRSPGVLTIDVRNSYETEIGTFEGAVDPHTDFFSEFPKFVEDNLLNKDQTIATFCTGGIRCERATAYLRQQGFTNVKHLKGGILNYLETIDASDSLWKGTCFVFDHRRSVDDGVQSFGEGKKLP
jgi:UPF0176 protein